MVRNPARPHTTSRRAFLTGCAGAGLVIGLRLPHAGEASAASDAFAPNAFVRIAPDNTITVIAKHLEFGQGVYTGLATILAEELDADWERIKVVSAPADALRYNNLFWGQAQGTGNSSSIANSWQQLREAGAAARAMLVQAAANAWRVPAAEVTAAKGNLSHAGSERSATYGAFALAPPALPLPESVTLKDPRAFSLIGTKLPRVDVAAKIDGSAVFALGVGRENMLSAVFARPPRFGGKVKSFDASAGRAIDGVVDVIAGSTRIAVLGTNFWAAKRGRDALKIEWDDTNAEMRGSAEILAAYRSLLDQPGLSARNDGDAETPIAGP